MDGIIVLPRTHRQWEVGRIQVHAFGKCAEGGGATFFVSDWNNPWSFRGIIRQLRTIRVQKVYMPIPSFKGNCVHTPTSATTHRLDEVDIITGYKADAVMLSRGSAAAFASADCKSVVVVNDARREAILCHGARYALLPAKLRPGELRIEDRGSEDDVLTTAIREAGWNNPAELLVHSFVGIGPENFTHPFNDEKYGSLNRQICAHLRKLDPACTPGLKSEGRPDLAAVIRAIAREHGISEHAIEDDGIDTYAYPDKWSSYRRDRADERNLIVAINP